MFRPGDVVRFWSDEAGKPKYHLCVSLRGHFVFINSPKSWRTHPGDFIASGNELPFIEPTPTNESIISCTLVMQKTDAQLRKLRARRIGSVSPELLRRLIHFIENSPVIPDEDKDDLLDGLGDWT